MGAIRHITLPAGFLSAGVACGIKASGRPDLAIIACQNDAAAAVLTTRNQVVGAPVSWCRRALPRGYGPVRGIVINSGCSNVCTGAAGLRDARRMAELTARYLGTRAQKVLVASTGVIGHRLPMAKVRRGIAAAAAGLGVSHDAATLAAIMTTDRRPKSAVLRARVGGRQVTLAGIVKGSGMIAPSLATLIAVITTDAAVAPPALHRALKVAGQRFDAITVDSDTSTSDTVAVLASARAGNAAISAGSSDFRAFAAMLEEVCGELAHAVVADGEGATKVITISVRGARSDAEARAAAKTVANSPLVKTAVHGGDPNWGRILAALGRSDAKIDADRAAVRIGGQLVFSRGRPTARSLAKVQSHLAGREVLIDCDLHLGAGRYTALSCDLSRQYVAINADYHT